ncbi:hypothetical protein TBLA_0A06740 [Henningerozyma blattae CBS 6284]|uniref:Lactoylglutathione lyase n=1 Tax=Henningerozyma blattae (strain ATCC 34711 / CBS 6284 / DSM 70876 / NBRC 10599 / NRRL Y-10934 / UCD 77-7) TaxID=1071380 RepID=I2GWG4_HENB6|nr:hypothetical protein TBLA_0A06740 [Tetrapisispora blattae CBS 6284]CCH58466.1 hypothetical protein TBLA_0A06740 [Tetrapisispora blattae CBS 6284]
MTTYFPTKITSAKDMLVNHTCLRVKDAARSVKFYEETFGMKMYLKKDFPEAKFSLYFLSFPKEYAKTSKGDPDVFGSSGILELTHNWGTENDADYKINNGNTEPHRGFGHICVSVADVKKYCEQLEAKNVAFKKRLTDGTMKEIAFVLDPDNYWIEVIQYIKKESESPKADIGPILNHTMYRIKDPKPTLEFYQNVLGMKLLIADDHPNGKFTNYFLAYGIENNSSRRSGEGVVELCHNWGTEDDKDFKYHTGNTQPQGYGHICVSTPNPEALCKEIESVYGDKIQWAPKWNQGKMKQIAFIKDPDGYSVEIIKRGFAL